MAKLTDREELATKIRATIEWNFGQICDSLDAAVEVGEMSRDMRDCLKRVVRKHGNESIRVIENHLEFHNITRNHRADKPNLQRVAARAKAQGQ